MTDDHIFGIFMFRIWLKHVTERFSYRRILYCYRKMKRGRSIIRNSTKYIWKFYACTDENHFVIVSENDEFDFESKMKSWSLMFMTTTMCSVRGLRAACSRRVHYMRSRKLDISNIYINIYRYLYIFKCIFTDIAIVFKIWHNKNKHEASIKCFLINNSIQ